MIDPQMMSGPPPQAAPMVGAPPPMAPPPPPNAPPGMPGAPPPNMGPMPAPPPGPPSPEKKPHLLLPPALAREMAQAYVDTTREMSTMVANQIGHPDEYERFKRKTQVDAWYKRDPRQDPLALKEQGLSPVEIRDKVYPLRKILLKMAGPRPTDRVKFVQMVQAERQKNDTISQGASRP